MAVLTPPPPGRKRARRVRRRGAPGLVARATRRDTDAVVCRLRFRL
ncbi:hypothetical protein [Streptomyces sp. SJL17-1]|nr:hypothetical protein [Streptomyces sp. SJL17-1]